MTILRVFADTNTLYPFYICDLLLRCSEEGLFEVLWTEDLLAELIEVIPRSGHKKTQAVQNMCAAIRNAFPNNEIPRSKYQDLIDQMPGNDPDDWLHSAAAIAGAAKILLTRDTSGFPEKTLARLGLRVTNVDQFLCEQFDIFPDDLIRILDEQIKDLTRSRPTQSTLFDHLSRPTSAPKFVGRVRRYLGLVAQNHQI